MKDFDLRKYLAENKLLKENIDEGRMKDPSGSIKMGKYPQVSSDTPVPMNVKYLTTNGEKLTMKVQAKNRKEAVDAVKSKDPNFKAEIKTDFVYDKDGNKLLKEDNLRDYWSEWAAGEIEVGNDGVIDAGGVDAEFEKVSDEAMNTFKDYVKAVKSLNADSKELRNDIAGAVSSILYDGGDFEDYTFDVLTADQYTKIQDII